MPLNELLDACQHRDLTQTSSRSCNVCKYCFAGADETRGSIEPLGTLRAGVASWRLDAKVVAAELGSCGAAELRSHARALGPGRSSSAPSGFGKCCRSALQLPAYRASASGCARLVFFFQAWFLRSPRRGMVGLRQELPSCAPYVSRSA